MAPGAQVMTRDERRLLALLGLPTFGLALSITIVSTYLPVLVREFTDSATVIGLIIGGEGVFALFLPLIVGSWSDNVETRLGRRIPFLAVAAPVAVLALVLMPFAPSIGLLAAATFAFFTAYFAYYPPYRALYPDLVAAHLHGRAQSSQALWRGIGLGAALVGGGALLALWRPLPFLLSAAALAAVTLVLLARVEEPREAIGCCLPHGLPETARRVWVIFRDHRDMRAVLAANALWELTLAALKSFIVLFIVVGLGRSVGFASALIGVVAAASLVAALMAGSLADRYGLVRVTRIALWVYGVGLLIPFLTQSPALVLPVLPLIAFGGAVIMTLPYGLLMDMMPPDSHGAVSGLYGLSRGLGTLLGPLLTGVAVDALAPVLESTDGYSAMFLVAGAAILLSIPLLRALGDRRPRALQVAPDGGPVSESIRPPAAASGALSPDARS